ncbi:unnamed protein product [Bursaphelenchus okinawaensis]|uniref:Lig_chan-Glu_bd domain-containing protein n=1 Tax=Bursaphelenchus okinawaensis TaxID=465554 RepID=A0A811K3A3_9BILA|nr:unnamed protein product [Bursaphelenchus okinawaensis]CAG9091283.1 unnamed protein product [Bursaphelenchus okinawaensis]
MNRTHLRVLFAGGLPAVNTDCHDYPVLTPRATCQFPGLHIEIIKRIADRMGLILDATYLEGELPIVGTVENNTITGMLGYVYNKTYDTIGLSVGQNEERKKYFEYSKPLYYSLNMAFINMPDNKWDKYFAYLQSYQNNSWIAIGIALMLQCLLTVIVHKVEEDLQKASVRHTVSESIWQIIRLQLLQPESLQLTSNAGKFSVVIFSLVQCTVIMGVLSSYIFSNLVRPPQSIPFKTFSQFTSLIAEGKLHLIDLGSAGLLHELIRTSNASDLLGLRHALVKNPLRVGNSVEEVMDMMDTPGAVLVRFDDEHLTFKVHEKCGLYIYDSLLPPSFGYLVFKKGFPYMNEVNRAVDLEHHNFRKMWLKYLRSYRGQLGCSPVSYRRIEEHYPYIGTVMMLALAEIIAFTLFVMELFVHYFYRKTF